MFNSGVRYTATTTSVPTNTWTHVAFARQNGVVTSFVNGVMDRTYIYLTRTITPASSVAWIGHAVDPIDFTGYIQDLRVTKGVNRYFQNFSTTATDKSSNTKLLLHFDGSDGNTTIIDSSSYGNTLTSNGGACTSTDYYKWGTSSAKFNAPGRYIKINDDTIADFYTPRKSNN